MSKAGRDKAARALIERIRDASGASEDVITHVLEECNYDANEAVARLIESPFLEVQTKQAKKKQQKTDVATRQDGSKVLEVRRSGSMSGSGTRGGRSAGRGERASLDRSRDRGGRGSSRAPPNGLHRADENERLANGTAEQEPASAASKPARQQPDAWAPSQPSEGGSAWGQPPAAAPAAAAAKPAEPDAWPQQAQQTGGAGASSAQPEATSAAAAPEPKPSWGKPGQGGGTFADMIKRQQAPQRAQQAQSQPAQAPRQASAPSASLPTPESSVPGLVSLQQPQQKLQLPVQAAARPQQQAQHQSLYSTGLGPSTSASEAPVSEADLLSGSLHTLSSGAGSMPQPIGPPAASVIAHSAQGTAAGSTGAEQQQGQQQAAAPGGAGESSRMAGQGSSATLGGPTVQAPSRQSFQQDAPSSGPPNAWQQRRASPAHAAPGAPSTSQALGQQQQEPQGIVGQMGLQHQAPGAAPGAIGMAQQAGLTSQPSEGQSHALRNMGQAGALMDQHRPQQQAQNAFSGMQQAAIGSGLHAQLPQKTQQQAPIGSALPGQQQLPTASAVPGQQQQIGQGQQGLGQLGAGLLSSLTGQSTQPPKSSGESQYQGLQSSSLGMSLMSSQDSQQGLQQQMPQVSRPAASLPEGTDQEMRLQFGNFSLNGLGADFGSAFGTAFGSSAGQEAAQAQSSSAEQSLLPNPQAQQQPKQQQAPQRSSQDYSQSANILSGLMGQAGSHSFSAQPQNQLQQQNKAVGPHTSSAGTQYSQGPTNLGQGYPGFQQAHSQQQAPSSSGQPAAAVAVAANAAASAGLPSMVQGETSYLSLQQQHQVPQHQQQQGPQQAHSLAGSMEGSQGGLGNAYRSAGGDAYSQYGSQGASVGSQQTYGSDFSAPKAADSLHPNKQPAGFETSGYRQNYAGLTAQQQPQHHHHTPQQQAQAQPPAQPAQQPQQQQQAARQMSGGMAGSQQRYTPPAQVPGSSLPASVAQLPSSLAGVNTSSAGQSMGHMPQMQYGPASGMPPGMSQYAYMPQYAASQYPAAYMPQAAYYAAAMPGNQYGGYAPPQGYAPNQPATSYAGGSGFGSHSYGKQQHSSYNHAGYGAGNGYDEAGYGQDSMYGAQNASQMQQLPRDPYNASQSRPSQGYSSAGFNNYGPPFGKLQ